MVNIHVSGVAKAIAGLNLVGAGAKAASGTIAGAALTVPWARFLEEGKARGRVRRAGPAWMFRDGAAAATPQVHRLVVQAVTKGPQAVGAAKTNGQRILVNEIRARTPVRTGYTRSRVEPIRGVR